MLLKELLDKNPLFVFALESEATNQFTDLEPLYVGVGKINAAYHLTKRIAVDKPSVIVNLGSAGSNTFAKGSVVCCTGFVQRDMDASMIGCEKYVTPFSDEPSILNYGILADGFSEGVCGTGDSFETSHSETIYSVVDMEAYSLACIAQKEGIPFLCLKYISDGADDNAADDWPQTIKLAAEALRKALNTLI